MIHRLALIFAVAMAAPAAAQTSSAVSLNSDVLVERTTTDAQGRQQVTLEEPRAVVPGDKLVFVLRYRNNGVTAASDFVVTNPLPTAVAFEGAGDERAQVSVDGGRNWGALAALSVREADGTNRAASI